MNLERKSFSILFEDELLSKIKSFDYQKLIDFMGETWTYEDVNLFEVVLNQCKGEHIKDNNDLAGKKSFDEALEELNYAFLYGRDTGTNGFMWYAETNELFNDNKEAILIWFESLASDYGKENIGDLIYELTQAKNFDSIYDLLVDDGEQTKNLIAKQLMYEISFDLNQTNLQDYANANVFDLKEIEQLLNNQNQESANNEQNTHKTIRRR